MRPAYFLFPALAAVGLAIALLWPHLPEGVDRRTVSFDGRKTTFLVITLPRDGWRFTLVNDSAHPKTVADWRATLDADLVVNAAYFLEDNTPAGYLRDDGVTSGAWPSVEEQTDTHSYTFLATIADDIALLYLPAAARDEPLVDSFLSFPTLLTNGTSLVTENSGLYAARTILAEANGIPYLIVTEKGDVSLFDAAQWLAAQPEGFTIAGNLDGGPSTGVSMKNILWDLEDRSVPVPSVLAGYRE